MKTQPKTIPLLQQPLQQPKPVTPPQPMKIEPWMLCEATLAEAGKQCPNLYQREFVDESGKFIKLCLNHYRNRMDTAVVDEMKKKRFQQLESTTK